MSKCTLMLIAAACLCLIQLTCLVSAMPTSAAAASGNQLGGGGHRLKRHHKRQIAPVIENAADYEPEQMQWVNPCGKSATMAPAQQRRMKSRSQENTADQMYALGLLKRSVNFNHNQLQGLTVIRTDDIAEWFTHNATYNFLRRTNQTDLKIRLPKWHIDTQIYVGAIQQLVWNQIKADTMQNVGHAQSSELAAMSRIAKLLLCELSDAIVRTGSQMPRILERREMDEKLKLRSQSIDMKFTKVRFAEYLDGLRGKLAAVTGRPTVGGGVPTPLLTKTSSLSRKELRERKHDVDHKLNENRRKLAEAGGQLSEIQRCALRRKIAAQQMRSESLAQRLRKKIRNQKEGKSKPARAGVKIGPAEQRRGLVKQQQQQQRRG